MIIGSKRARHVAAIPLLAMALQACAPHHMTRIRPPAPDGQLEPGDRVTMTLKNGRSYSVVVVATSDTHLTTRVAKYDWAEIDHITIAEVDTVGTVVSYSLLAVLIAGAARLAAEDAFED